MLFRGRKKRGLYYLLPGMARSNRRHNVLVMRWSIAFGIIFSILFGLLIYYLSR